MVFISFGVVIFDIESLTKVLYYLINFWGNDEIFIKFISFAIPFIIPNTFIVLFSCSIAWSAPIGVNGTYVLSTEK